MAELLSIEQAAAQGIERVRLPIWAHPLDHIKIDIVNGKPGPWLHLYAPFNMECNGRDPVDICWPIARFPTPFTAVNWLPYGGPLPESDEYKAAAASFSGCLSDQDVTR